MAAEEALIELGIVRLLIEVLLGLTTLLLVSTFFIIRLLILHSRDLRAHEILIEEIRNESGKTNGQRGGTGNGGHRK